MMEIIKELFASAIGLGLATIIFIATLVTFSFFLFVIFSWLATRGWVQWLIS